MISILPLWLPASPFAHVQPQYAQSIPAAAQASSLVAQAANTAVPRIYCGIIDGIPTTISEAGGKTIPLINWISTSMSGSGYTPKKRCEIVSAKFESYRSQGALKYITTGRENRLPVICVAQEKLGPCIGTLYTLKQDQDPVATLERLFHLRRGASGAIYESGGLGRIYVEFDKFISRP